MRELIQYGLSYKIIIPANNKGYSNNQLCTYSIPPPRTGYLYEYLFPDQPIDIEQSSNSQCRCLDSLFFEHTENGNPPVTKNVLSCGDTIDKRLDGKVLTSKITITFRSNEKERRIGGSFFVYEYTPMVSKTCINIGCVHVCVCACMHVLVRICVHSCVCTYVCMYV